MRKTIQRIYQHATDPFGALWRWGSGHTAKRWNALRLWARSHVAHATSDKDKAYWTKKAQAYGEKKQRWLKNHADPKPPPQSGLLVTFDGLQVPRWIASILQNARNDGVSFHVISGYRSPAYSTSLCMGMCGAPQCPGTCAGAASNHACPPSGKGVPYEGAVDVFPGAPALESWCRAHNQPLYGNGFALGSADMNHFSHTGR